MAFNGTLVKVGNYTIDAGKYIKANSYKVTRSVSDLDAYRDANGELHRNALDHIVYKVDFETPAMLDNLSLSALFKAIQANYINPKERKVSLTLYVPELDDYITQDAYMPDPEVSIYAIMDGKIKYNAVRLAFIGY